MTPEDNQDMIKCRVCFEPLHKGAVKCIHCGSFQNWQRFLNIGSGILSLLVALIAVLTVAVPIIKSSLTTKRPDVHFTLIKYEPKTMHIICSNLGNRSGILKQATLRILMNGGETDETKASPVFLKWEEQDPIIKPNESRLFKFYYEFYGDRQALKKCSPGTTSCQYNIQFEIIEPNNKSRKTEKFFPCFNCGL
jgi:hypothetical protein